MGCDQDMNVNSVYEAPHYRVHRQNMPTLQLCDDLMMLAEYFSNATSR